METWEIGAKSTWWDQRARLNIAAFSNDFDNIQIDITAAPAAPNLIETINAEGTVEVDGFELDFEFLPLEGLIIGLNYTYLDGEIEPQFNTLTNLIEPFENTQTPQHAGSLTIDYTFLPMTFGTLSAHVDVTSTDRYSYVAYSPEQQRFDAYTLLNARITLSDISVGNKNHSLNASIWGRNITDEDYIAFALPNAQAFGTPRTIGVDITYNF